MIPVDRWQPADGLALETNAMIAATETKRNLALTAGPGAGKTEVLAQRADFLLQTGTCRYPSRILAISFKVDASQNLRARVRDRCGPELAHRFDSFTFHAFAKLIIDRFRPVLTGRDALDADYDVGKARVHRKSITFDDMVPLAATIVSTSPIARNAIRQTYGQLFLDEFQDCTTNQYRLLRECFLGTGIQVVAVGDVKQSIMGFAGAMDGIFETYAKDFSARPLHLYQNFRSAPHLRRMQNAMVRTMDPTAAVKDEKIVGDEGKIEILRSKDDSEEATKLARKIRRWVDEDEVPASQIAVLVSRQEALYCEKLHEALQAAGVAFRVEDREQNLTAEPAARLITDFLLITGSNRQPAAFKRLLDLVVYGHDLDDEGEYKARGKWNRFLEKTSADIRSGTLRLARRTDLDGLTANLIDTLGRGVVVSLSPDYAHGPRLEQVIEETLTSVHEHLALEPDIGKALATLSSDNAVRVMSVHKCKGLEFNAVIVLGVEEETFWGEIDAERKVFFVAISRAREKLVLTVSRRRERPKLPVRRWDEERTEQQEFLGYADGLL